ncbi:hypothetical protein NX821_002321 [Clostridium septicum]|uniref:hypothetical protein n=1 Tax=Clostridium septicum TaxID=1504 RepID=UPI003217C314
MENLNIFDMEQINGGADAGLIATGVVSIVGGVIAGATGNPIGAGIGLYTGAVSITAAFGD